MVVDYIGQDVVKNYSFENIGDNAQKRHWMVVDDRGTTIFFVNMDDV